MSRTRLGTSARAGTSAVRSSWGGEQEAEKEQRRRGQGDEDDSAAALSPPATGKLG